MTMLRVGIGFDMHPFRADGPLVLGGVTIEGSAGLAGHSDADALAHAVSDAVLGAAGLPDLGTLYPATDATPVGASSLGFLRDIAGRLADAGWCVVNVDAVVAAEVPRLAPHIATMEGNLAAALRAAREPGCDGVPVSVKPKRAEGLGAIGRAEGIAVVAVALLSKRESSLGG